MWRNFAFLLTAQTSWEEKGTHISKVEQRYCLSEECQERLERKQTADLLVGSLSGKKLGNGIM